MAILLLFGDLMLRRYRYSAVVRAPGAYVPPGARRNGSGPTPNQANPPPAASPSPGPAPAQAAAAAAPSPATTTNGTAPPVPTITTPSADDSAPKVWLSQYGVIVC